MLATGILLLFLAPGVAAYAAFYGLFHDGKAITPEPPAANTIEAVTIIAGAALIAHVTCGAIFSLNDLLCDDRCPIKAKAAWLDPYHSAIVAMGGQGISGAGVTLVLLGVTLQSIASYAGVRFWLDRRARQDRLPAWIYGWATSLANALDNDDSAVIAYVLTKTVCGDRTLAYGGLVHNLSMKPDGTITRIALTECERYLVDLQSTFDTASLLDALSRFSFMTIDADNVQNVAFEVIDLAVYADDVDPPGAPTISAA